MAGNYVVGTPYDRSYINGVFTEQYRINSANTDVPVYAFSQNINGTIMNFEIVSSTFSGQNYVYEEAPKPGNTFSLIYQNDNQGYGSANTGFFVHFREGKLTSSNFGITTPVPNEIIGVNNSGINNTDVWLWQLALDGTYDNLWTKVADIIGNNIIYNSLSNDVRNIYSVTSRDQDQIDLKFSDGSFGNLPVGNFQLFYRQSNGLVYTIHPDQMNGIVVQVPYYNKNGQRQTLTFTLALQYTVNNSSATESNASIQTRAPQSYYLQNRMVTAEDYNIAPLTLNNDILKVKSINRISSGISKYYDLSDVSSKYSSTNIFASDGILYKNTREQNFQFTFTNRNNITAVVNNQLASIVSSTALRSFYFDEYSRPDLSALSLTWVQVNKSNGQSRGYFKDSSSPQKVGLYSTSNLQYVVPGALVKFVPPSGKYFNSHGNLVSSQNSKTVNYIWTTVTQVYGDGSNSGKGALDDGTGPVVLSNTVDSLAIPVQVIPKFISVFSNTLNTEIIDLCVEKRNFGLSFIQSSRQWQIISDTNLDTVRSFDLTTQGNINNSSQDSSWIISFTWTGTSYKVRYRITDFIFSSDKQTAFYIDSTSVNYDFVTDTVVKDQVKVLSYNAAYTPSLAANTATGSIGKDFIWQIDSAIVESDGYIDPQRVNVSFYDYNNLGQILDPDAFNNIVEPDSIGDYGYKDKFVYFQYQSDGQTYKLVDHTMFAAFPTPADVNFTPNNGDLFYFYDPAYNVVNSYSTSTQHITYPWVYESSYFAFPGRDELNFQYLHNTGENRRIDPSKSNIIDVYVLTTAYDTDYRTWLSTGIGSEPVAPTSQSLENNYAATLEPIKTISDQMIFQSVKYKVLFGSQADYNLQATFKAVQSPTSTMSANSIKSSILSAINNFFALENWDFGQSFHFSELSTYVMNLLTPDVTNFIIIPKSGNFGSLYEIACQSTEILISGAIASDIEVIDAVTASQLNTTTITNSTGS